MAVPSKLPMRAGASERLCSGLPEPLAASGRSRVTTSDSKSSPTTSSTTALPQSSSVHRKSSLSRLPAPGTYVIGKTGMQAKLPSDGPADASAVTVDKRKTLTAIRSLSIRNSATKSGPLKAMPSSVTPIQPDCVDGVFLLNILQDILCCFYQTN